MGTGLSLLHTLLPLQRHLIPSGVAFAIGMYLPPFWTIPRVIGGLVRPFCPPFRFHPSFDCIR